MSARIAEFNWQVGRQVEALRKEAEMSQTDLARALGEPFHQPTVVRVESGQRPLRLEEAARVAAIFRVTIDDLLSDTPPVGTVAADQVRYERLGRAVAEMCAELGGGER